MNYVYKSIDSWTQSKDNAKEIVNNKNISRISSNNSCIVLFDFIWSEIYADPNACKHIRNIHIPNSSLTSEHIINILTGMNIQTLEFKRIIYGSDSIMQRVMEDLKIIRTMDNNFSLTSSNILSRLSSEAIVRNNQITKHGTTCIIIDTCIAFGKNNVLNAYLMIDIIDWAYPNLQKYVSPIFKVDVALKVLRLILPEIESNVIN